MKLYSKYYNELLRTVYPLYPDSTAVSTIIKSIGLEQGDVDLHGAAKQIWNSVLTLAEDKDKLEPLLKSVSAEFSNITFFTELLANIENSTAIVPTPDYANFADKKSFGPCKVFLVYDKEDTAIVSSLKKQLVPLERFSRIISIFDMHTLHGGTADTENFLLQNLGDAKIVLLMLTPDFFGNIDNYCDVLMFAGIDTKKTVIPVLMRDCLWDRIEALKNIVPLPKNKVFVSAWDSKDLALKTIAIGMEEVARNCKVE